MSSKLGPNRPFVGLRPFTTGDHDWFFGRLQHSLSMYQQLCRVRFVAVVGGSGCGKSSAVSAGLLPLLAEETAAEGGRYWRWWQLRPGDSPIAKLAETLSSGLKRDANGIARSVRAARRERLEFVLRKSSFGLVDALRELAIEPGTIPVIVIDQFEELFRFAELPGTRVAREHRWDEATAFVQLLLEATRCANLPVRVVLTLRSDNLGDCALFDDLSEAVSRGEYLLSALTRDQREHAIRGPIEKAGATIDDELVERLLNDGCNGHDQLPVLQHTLLRTWNHVSNTDPRHLQPADYEAIGGIESGISRHADEILAQPALKDLGMAVEQVFRALAGLDHQGRRVRRALAYGQLVAESAIPEAHVRVVVDSFRDVDCCFLLPLFVEGQPLGAEDSVEFWQEALIRRWVRMTDEESGEQRGWLYEEAYDGRTYAALLGIAKRGATSGALATLPFDQVKPRVSWWQSRPRTSAWADRYGGDLDSVEKLISDSAAQLSEAEQEKAKAKFKRRALLVSVLIGGIALPLLVWVYWQFQVATEQRLFAEQTAASAVQALANLQMQHKRDKVSVTVTSAQRTPTGTPIVTAEKHTAIAAAEELHSDVSDAPIASSSQAVSAALAALSGNHRDRALLLSVAAMRIEDTPDAQDVLLRSLQRARRVPRFLSGHEARIHSVALSRKGKLLASGGGDKRVILWDAVRRKAIGAPLIGHQARVSSLAFSPDAATLVSGAANELIFWDVRSRKQLGVVSIYHHKVGSRDPSSADALTSISFNTNGKLLAAGLGHRVLLFDVARRQQLGMRLQGNRGHVLSVAFSHNGKTVASGSADGQLSVWNLSTGQPLANWPRRNPGSVEVVAFNPTGTILAGAGSDKSIILRDITTGKPIANLLNGHQHNIANLVFNRSGKTLASASLDQRVALWDIARKTRRTLPLAGTKVHALSAAFSANGKALAYGGRDNRVALWDLTESNVLSTPLVGHSDRVTSVSFSPNGRLLASGSSDASVVLWDPVRAKRASRPLTGHQGEISSLAFSPDGKTLASGSVDRSAILWDVLSRKPVGRALLQDQSAIRSVAFSPDGKVLATGGDSKRVTLWDVTSRKRTDGPTLQSDGKIRTLVFSPDGKTLAAGSVDKGVAFWDASNGTRLNAPSGEQPTSVRSLAFSPDGKIFAVGGVGRPVTLWNAINREPLGEPLTKSQKDVWGVAFGPDNKLIASTGQGGRVVLWNVASRKQLGRAFVGHTNVGSSIAFSPDSRLIASGGHDNRVLLWKVSAKDWIAIACRIANRNLSQREWLRYVGQHVPYQRVCP